MDPLDDYDDIDALNEEDLVYLERRFPNLNRELFNDLLALTDGDVEDVVRLLSMYPDKPKQTPAPRNNITDVNVPTNNTEHKEGPDSDSDIEIVAIRTGPVGTPSRKKQKHKLQRDKQHPAPSSSSSSLLQTSDSTAQSCSIPLIILDGDDNDSPISKPVASNSSQSSRRSISARPDPNPTEFGINYVSEMFPDCAPEFICEIIKSCGGSLEQATDALLKNPSYPKRSVVQLGKRKRTDDIIDDDTDLTAVNENEVKSAEYTSAWFVLQYTVSINLVILVFNFLYLGQQTSIKLRLSECSFALYQHCIKAT
ncbi:hypothetical protein BKA69DRAFT_426668 [Paraphysoderma sedebokerense]|nr:hypothetical protein BKA69DRAFT_426668 [Paraphysoderma sedebokerense]